MSDISIADLKPEPADHRTTAQVMLGNTLAILQGGDYQHDKGDGLPVAQIFATVAVGHALLAVADAIDHVSEVMPE